MTHPPPHQADADPRFSRAIVMAALVEAAFVAAGIAAYFVTRNIVLLLVIAIAGTGLFGLLLRRAWNHATALKAAGPGAEPIVRDGRGPP